MFDIETARQRDGEADTERPDRVNEILNRPRLGYGESDQLVGDDYESYPETPDELTTPSAREFVAELFDSPLVSSIDDAIVETTPATADRHLVADWREAFERASELFGVEIGDDDSDDSGAERESRLAELTEEYPDDMVEASNELVVSHLYAELGLSTDEIADVFSDDSERSIKPKQVRRLLRSVGLIENDDSGDSEPSYQLGGTTLSVDMTAVERADSVTIERDA